MPRSKLDKFSRDPAAEHRELVNRIIRKAMFDYGYDRKRQALAEKMGLSLSWFNAKLRDSKWTLEELTQLARLLHLTAADAAMILGVKAA